MNTLEIVKLTDEKTKALYLMDVAKANHFIYKTGRVDPASHCANPVRAHKALLSMLENKTATVLVAVQDAAYQGSIVLNYNDERFPDDIYMGALFTRGDAPYKTALKLIMAAVEEAIAKGKIALTITEGPTKKSLHRADTRLGFEASGHVTACGQRVFKANADQVWKRLSTRHSPLRHSPLRHSPLVPSGERQGNELRSDVNPPPICIQEVSAPPVPAALQFVASAAHVMHEMEGGDEMAIGATVLRAYDHLYSLIVKGSGAALVATVDAQFAGCVFVEFAIGQNSHIALASALYTMPGVPRKTALQLMRAAALLCRRRGKSVVWMLAGTERNQQRPTYRRMGFVDTEMTQGDSGRLYKANLSDIEIALEKRIKLRKDGITWDQS